MTALRSASRREFLKDCLTGAATSPSAVFTQSGQQTQNDTQFAVEAKFYEKLPNRKIKCKLCPRECNVGDKERGYCGVRENRGGPYYTLTKLPASAEMQGQPA